VKTWWKASARCVHPLCRSQYYPHLGQVTLYRFGTRDQVKFELSREDRRCKGCRRIIAHGHFEFEQVEHDGNGNFRPKLGGDK